MALGCIQSPLQCANRVSLPEGKVAGACGWLLISIECWDHWREVVLPLFCPLLWHVVLSATALTLLRFVTFRHQKQSLTTSTATFGSNDDEFDLRSCGVRQKLRPHHRVSWRRVFLVLFCHCRQIPEYSPQIWPRPYLKWSFNVIFFYHQINLRCIMWAAGSINKHKVSKPHPAD